MEKITLTQEMLDNGKSFEELGIQTLDTPLPYSVILDAAYELFDNVVIVDSDNIVYESISKTLEEFYIYAKYFTNINTDGIDKEKLYDLFSRCGQRRVLIRSDFREIAGAYTRMFVIVRERYAYENSLAYKFEQMMDSQVNDNTEKLIELLNKVKDVEASEKVVDLSAFSKKK